MWRTDVGGVVKDSRQFWGACECGTLDWGRCRLISYTETKFQHMPPVEFNKKHAYKKPSYTVNVQIKWYHGPCKESISVSKLFPGTLFFFFIKASFHLCQYFWEQTKNVPLGSNFSISEWGGILPLLPLPGWLIHIKVPDSCGWAGN